MAQGDADRLVCGLALCDLEQSVLGKRPAGSVEAADIEEHEEAAVGRRMEARQVRDFPGAAFLGGEERAALDDAALAEDGVMELVGLAGSREEALAQARIEGALGPDDTGGAFGVDPQVAGRYPAAGEVAAGDLDPFTKNAR